MALGIDFVGTNLGSGTKTYNINFCNQLNKTHITENIKVFICKHYLSQIDLIINKNNKVQYIIKSDLLSITLLRLLWMQFVLPFELKLLGIKKFYSPMNFSPILAKLLNIKIVLCLHSNLPWIYFNMMPGSKIRNFITKKLMEISIYNSDLLIVDSFFAKKEISKNLNLKKKKIKVVYLNISNNFFSTKFNKKSIVCFNYNTKYILSVISCVKYHNIINLLAAFKLLIKEINLSIKLVLVLQILDRKYFSEVKEYIKNNFDRGKILIYINLDSDKLPKLYSFAQVYVFTSYCEVFGLTTLEAMSQNTPVVISNRSALPEINGKAAQYFDPDNIEEIKNSIKKVIVNQKLKNKLIRNGKEWLKNFYSENNVKKTIDIIQSLR
jgi:glycosyltransferase involved in cell wall biosynthesis